jgi:hypothetical protein
MIFLTSVLGSVWEFVKNPKNTRLIMGIGLVILFILLMRQCDSAKRAQNETVRIKNNQIALNDTIRNYKDKYGNSVGEIRGLTLTLDEVRDSLEYEKGRPPVTVIKWKTIIVDREVDVPVVLTDSTMQVKSEKTWGKSSRSLFVEVPYKVDGTKLKTGNATFELNQDIWLEAKLSKDDKTKEVFVQLKTDYPNVTFNNARGILIENPNILNSTNGSGKKTLGIGLQIGVGIGNAGVAPFVGVGLNYTPKFLQF